MRIKPLWYYSKHWECEYSLTWRLRTHESIKITTGIFYVGVVGMLLQDEWLCSVQRQGLAQTGAGTATDSAWVSTWQEEAEQPWPSQPTWISGGEIPLINPSPGGCIPPQVRVAGEKSAHGEDTRLVLTGRSPGDYPSWEKAGVAGNLRKDFCGCCWTSPSENRAARRGPVSTSPGGAAPAATHNRAKQGLSLSKFSCFPVLLYPTDQLVPMEKPGRAG